MVIPDLKRLGLAKKEPEMDWKACIFATLLILGVLLGICKVCRAEEVYTNEQIADAIFMAEGGARAKVPYGILSVKVKNKAEARRVCLNTIRNNRRRYAEYGYKKYPTYLEFLASRYCPVGAVNDLRNLNIHWLSNVRYFLNKN